MRELLAGHPRSYAEQGGITLRDKPSPLFRLLVLCLLASAPIGADLAAAASHELSRAGWRTARRLAESSWQERVDALGRAHYRRYDESTATELAKAADHVLRAHRGDLRRIRPERPDDVPRLRGALTEVPRIGPVGADIFCREAQAVWPALRPWFDDRALAAARGLDLPDDPAALAALAPRGAAHRLAHALEEAERR
ncbi:hypothetical protein GCM10011519_20310 [Marmoricola endophyticus]|uniref:Endonuclease n=1 Tax=Marmoricola endophyticus TaxID=2040280 RepID=A0A917BK44_9ACTN|nr:hypothetical protein GCM10011519_20310 [Marmoricola endophyticus]